MKRSIKHRSTNWMDLTQILMQTAIVVCLTGVPSAVTEHLGVPVKATAIVLDTSSLKAPIIVDAHSASAVCLPMDWVDKARLVSAS